MNKLRRAIKLLCPMGPVVLWTKWRHPTYELKEKTAVRGALKCIWWVVPYGVFCVNAQMTAADRQPLKYWAPYGKMCRIVAERYGVVVNRGTLEDVHDCNGYLRTMKNEGVFSPFVRFARRISPYGLILWWDRSATKASAVKPAPAPARPAPAPARPAPAQARPAPAQAVATSAEARALAQQVKALEDHLKRVENLINVKSDNLEIQLLKLRLAVKEFAKE